MVLTAYALTGHGMSCANLGEYRQALRLQQEALSIVETQLAPSRGKGVPEVPESGASQSLLATVIERTAACHAELQKYDKALELYERALALRKASG